jgi:hypothetical protein
LVFMAVKISREDLHPTPVDRCSRGIPLLGGNTGGVNMSRCQPE